MPNTIIHIGYPKTATTWFQINFYPWVRNYQYSDREVVKKELIFRNAIELNSDSVYRGQQNLIICEEMLIGSVQNGALHGLLMEKNARRIKRYFPDAEIVIFIRNQFELIKSSWLQYLRTGGTLSFRKFLFPSRKLNQINQFFLFDFTFFEFSRIIEFYRSVFGEQKIHVFLFEEFRENPGNFLKNYAEQFNLSIDLGQINLGLRKSSFPLWLVPVVRFLNTFTNQSVLNKYYIINIPGMYGLVRKLILIYSKRRNHKMVPYTGSRVIRDYIENYYRGSNRKLTGYFPEEKLRRYNYPL